MTLLDISTGEFFVVMADHDTIFQNILPEIARYRPAECILPAAVPDLPESAVPRTGCYCYHLQGR